MDKAKIKVIKGSAIKKQEKVKSVSPRATAREMVSTVSDWVADVKARKTEETKAAFDLLFASNRRPNET